MSRIQNFVSAACKYFLFVTLHCTALQSCYQKLTPHRAAPQIIYLNRKFLDIFSFFKKVFIQTIRTVVVIKVSPYISDSIPIGISNSIVVSLGKTLYGTFPCLVALQAVLNYSNISTKLLVDDNILPSPSRLG